MLKPLWFRKDSSVLVDGTDTNFIAPLKNTFLEI